MLLSPFQHGGVADISGLHALSKEYPRALSIILAYTPSFKIYSEEEYHHLLKKISLEIDTTTSAISAFLKAVGIKHFLVPQGGQDPETLLAKFPHKLAATRAGLGWIGKNSLLVTSKYGPRVRLATLLIDSDFPCGEPVNVPKCGECMACVEACPYAYIKGKNWYPGMQRNDLLNAHLCSAEREAYRSIIGHKHECGFCLLVCPFGNVTGKVTIEKAG